MSDQSGGPDWWQASDSKWYPPQPPAVDPPGDPSPPPLLTSEPLSWWKKRVPLWAVIVIGVAGLALGFASSSTSEKKDDSTTAAAAGESIEVPGTNARPTGTTMPTTTTTLPDYMPVPADYKINVITTSKECFGTAGCNVEFTISVGYVGNTEPGSSTRTYTVIYDILGGEDPQTNSFDARGNTLTFDDTGRIQTTSSSAVITAVPTSVIIKGL